MSNREDLNIRRHRFCRIAKWSGLFINAALVIAFAASAIQPLGCSVDLGANTYELGVTHVDRDFWIMAEARSAPGAFIDSWTTDGWPRLPGWSSFGSGSRTVCRRLYVPAWMPLLALVAPTAFVWYLDHRRRPRPGHCPSCNYNLTGNTSGICPECGTAIDTNARSKTLTTE
jgi:predicted RNA-binding Zn-ribbon protein involved in translation (DUF1610 family)